MCQRRPRNFGRSIWYRYSHFSAKPCRWCGQSYTHGQEMEIGSMESFRFILSEELPS
jgi:hypothetical protein